MSTASAAIAGSSNGDSTVLRLATGVAAGGIADLGVAVEVRVPASAGVGVLPIALVCIPGGGMNRRYYDLMPERAEPRDTSYSFARQMAGRGFIVVTIDSPGVGDSDRPEDAYTLTPEVVTAALASATAQVLERLRSGRLGGELPALPDLVSIGLGHSMGAMLTVLQQAARRQHAAVALLGFSTRGLPEFLSPQAQELAREPAAARAELVPLARAAFAEPFQRAAPRNGGLYGGAKAEPRGVDALKRAMDKMLPVPAMLSMLPGNVAPEAAQIDVPVFLGLGELDMAGPPHQIPAAFGASRDVCLHLLPEAGHSHFLFAARAGLFKRLAAWARLVAEYR